MRQHELPSQGGPSVTVSPPSDTTVTLSLSCPDHPSLVYLSVLEVINKSNVGIIALLAYQQTIRLPGEATPFQPPPLPSSYSPSLPPCNMSLIFTGVEKLNMIFMWLWSLIQCFSQIYTHFGQP